jgi:hypothetical protein
MHVKSKYGRLSPSGYAARAKTGNEKPSPNRSSEFTKRAACARMGSGAFTEFADFRNFTLRFCTDKRKNPVAGFRPLCHGSYNQQIIYNNYRTGNGGNCLNLHRYSTFGIV